MELKKFRNTIFKEQKMSMGSRKYLTEEAFTAVRAVEPQSSF